MNDKKSANAVARAKASVIEAIGKLTGDKVVEEKGAAQKRDVDNVAAKPTFEPKTKKP